jgi:hypothetical protein
MTDHDKPHCIKVYILQALLLPKDIINIISSYNVYEVIIYEPINLFDMFAPRITLIHHNILRINEGLRCLRYST